MIYSEAKGDTRQLVIEKVEKSDAGEYTCEAGGDKLVFKITVAGTRTPVTNKHIKERLNNAFTTSTPLFHPSSSNNLNLHC